MEGGSSPALLPGWVLIPYAHFGWDCGAGMGSCLQAQPSIGAVQVAAPVDKAHSQLAHSSPNILLSSSMAAALCQEMPCLDQELSSLKLHQVLHVSTSHCTLPHSFNSSDVKKRNQWCCSTRSGLSTRRCLFLLVFKYSSSSK